MFQIDLNSMFISILIMNFTVFGCDEIQGHYNIHPKQIVFYLFKYQCDENMFS